MVSLSPLASTHAMRFIDARCSAFRCLLLAPSRGQCTETALPVRVLLPSAVALGSPDTEVPQAGSPPSRGVRVKRTMGRPPHV